ncbi:hypothetical protein A2J03_03060 [Rhodococcus sp. EPR-157]|nr:hypothetical protein A2J03_03060 [Rhodococcus sp. EPR-157]
MNSAETPGTDGTISYVIHHRAQDMSMPNNSTDEGSGSSNEGFNSQSRGEIPEQSLDRNWMSLIQEHRVVKAGVWSHRRTGPPCWV